MPGPRVVRAAPKPRAGGDPDDPVFAALREWRTGVAQDEAMPPYVIAHQGWDGTGAGAVTAWR